MRWCRENCPSVGEAVHPIDPFVYVVVGADGSGASGFDAYTIDEHTGKLSAVAGSPFASGAAPDSAAVDASGRFVYVTDQSSGVFAFRIDPSTGSLSPLGGSPFTAGQVPCGIATCRQIGSDRACVPPPQ